MSEDTGGFLLLQTYIPNLYPELLLPLDDKDKIIQKNLDLRNCDLRKNLDLRKIVATTKILVHKMFDLRKIF